MFETARERVDREGGVRGLRERERVGRRGWEGDGEEGEDVDEEREEEEEAGYTMDMMLRSLNVEVGVIGFDKGLQKWVD